MVDMKIVMQRLTPLPELKQIQVKHTGKADDKITLIGVLAQSRPNGEFVAYKVGKHIVRNQRRYNLKRHKEDVYDIEADSIQPKTLKTSQLSLKTLELIFILFVVISFIGFVAEILHQTWMFSSPWQRITIHTLICALLGITFALSFIWLYKSLILLEISYQKRFSVTNEKCFKILILVFQIFSTMVALFLNITVLFYKLSDDSIESFNWFAVTFCSSAVTICLWNVVIQLLSRQSAVTPMDDSEMSVSSQMSSQISVTN